MRGLAIAVCAVAMGTSLASAADMRIPVKAPPVAAVYSWTGFYVGGNVGYSWGDARNDQTDTLTTSSITRAFRTDTGAEVTAITGSAPFANIVFPIVGPTTTLTSGTSGKARVDGVVGGIQGGYNWQFDRSWIVGIETDFQGSGERGGFTTCTAGCVAGSAFGSAFNRLDWYGSTRLRLGVLPHERVFLYTTGGVAYGHLRSNYESGFIGQTLLTGSTGRTRVGWIAGAGVEGAIDRNWTVRAEYFYMDLGRFGTDLGSAAATVVGPSILVADNRFRIQTTTTTTGAASVTTRFVDHIGRIAFNYRF